MISKKQTHLAFIAATLIAVGVAAAIPTGCGGGNASSETATGRAYGTLQLEVSWPAADTRVIPPPTDKIVVVVTALNGFFADGTKQNSLTITRAAGATGLQAFSFPGIPTGDVTVAVAANDKDGTTIARAASQLVRVQPGVVTNFSASLVVEPFPIPTITALTITPTSVLGGATAKAEITLSGAAPPQGVDIFPDYGGLSGVSKVTIPYKETKGTFDIVTTDVSTTATKTVKVSYNSSEKSATLEVRRLLSSVTVSPSTVVGANDYAYNGSNPPSEAQNVTGTVLLAEPAPKDVNITVYKSGYDARFANGNSDNYSGSTTVTIPAGQTSKTFLVWTDEVGLPSYPSSGSNAFNTYTETVSLYAQLGNAYTNNTTLTITPRHQDGGHGAAGNGTCSNCHHTRAVRVPADYAATLMGAERFK